MPEDLDLTGGFTIRLTALNPSDGSVVPGITVSSLVMMVNTGGSTDTGSLGFGDFLLVPGVGA